MHNIFCREDIRFLLTLPTEFMKMKHFQMKKVMLTLYSALWLCLSDAHFDSPLYRSLHCSTSLKQALYVSLNRTAESLYICEISGSHGGKYEDDSLLEYSAV
jgi:hypothetical protein